MSNPEFGPQLSKQGQEALNDLNLTLEAKNIPEEERQGYVDKLVSKIAGVDDEDMIDLALGNILLEVTKKAKERKS